MSAGREIMNTAMQAARQEAKSYAASVCIGEVTSVDPLKVKLQDGLELTEDFLVVSCFCKETVIKIPQDDNAKHAHTMEEALVDYQAVGNLGAPIVFAPMGMEMYVANPDFDPERPATDDDVPGTPDNPRRIQNPAIPSPNTLPLKHLHAINPALESIMLWRGLEHGDKVLMIKFPPYQFLILQRVEGITNDPESE